LYYSKEHWWVPISPPYILFLYQHSFARNFRLQFSVGVANPRFWGRGGRRGSGIVSFERALVSFYIGLYLYAFQRYCRFCSRERHFFHTPPLVSPKFPHVLVGVGVSPYGYRQRRCWSCNFSFQDFQPMWSQSTNVTDRQTYRRHAIARPRFALKCIAR